MTLMTILQLFVVGFEIRTLKLLGQTLITESAHHGHESWRVVFINTKKT